MDITSRLSAVIESRSLTLRAAAAEIGVTLNTLERHLNGEHVRSDSVRKYEDWLSGRTTKRNVFRKTASVQIETQPVQSQLSSPLPSPPERPHLVVDIFSGCGGLSLGFDLLGGGQYFRTVLAMDVVPATVEVMNRNHTALHADNGGEVARVVDLTEFLNETEIVAFYLDHVVQLNRDEATRRRLDELSNSAFPQFLSTLRAIDKRFIEELAVARERPAYRNAYSALDKGVLGQTSVVGFQHALKLPRAARVCPTLPPVVWADTASARSVDSEQDGKMLREIPATLFAEARELWERELGALDAKKKAKGQGQLTSSARRIKTFVDFVRSTAFAEIREAWCRWQAARIAVRASIFQNEDFARELRALYEETYPVAVLLGGPPCQGFSRIGRGKIRSLREAHVHVHGDEEAGDTRNFLYQRYLLVVSALRPSVFKFENVQHFQSTVKTDGHEFLASEILAEAIAEMSEGEASYAVASRTVDASRHAVPQTRQRFFMSGVRRGVFLSDDIEDLPTRCLTLPIMEDVPLSVALEGLPDAYIAGGDLPSGAAMSSAVALSDQPAPASVTAATCFRAWVRQPAPRQMTAPAATDAHAARAAREDDAELFSLFGPGKRWMDYRVDDAPTLAELRNVLNAVATLPATAYDKIARALPSDGPSLPSPECARELLGRLDGSLALRLLMEQIGDRLDAPHHLVTPTYLSKRDGNHGDWLARLDGSRPCKTIVAHMAKDTYGYVHPSAARTLSVREAARVQTFPDWYSFGAVALTDALKMIGNAVPPLLSHMIAARVATILAGCVSAAGTLTEAA